MAEAVPGRLLDELEPARLDHPAQVAGLADVALRPPAAAIGSSTRVLLYLLLADIGAEPGVARRLWDWLSSPAHRPVLTLWLEVLRAAQPEEVRDTAAGPASRTRELALLRGSLPDLLATGDGERVTAALRASLTP